MHTKSDADLNIDSSLILPDLDVEEIADLPDIPGLESCTDAEAVAALTNTMLGIALRGKYPPGIDAAIAAAPSRRAKRISLRVPAHLLAKFKEKAGRVGVGYQTLMIRELTAAVKHESFH